MKLSFPKAAALALVSLLAPLSAQSTEELLTTVGTTVSVGGTTQAYILWQPGDAASTLGKRFAIYAKPGQPGDAGDFTRLGIQTLQTSPNTIRAMLELGRKIDRAADAANTRISVIHRDVQLRSGDAVDTPDDPSLDAAAKLSYLIQSAVTDPKLLSRLFFLGRAHPGVMQVLGHAFSVPVPAGVRTFEVREIDLSDNDLRVVGRVALDPANPLVLAAPAAPFQVFHPVNPGSQYEINPKDHLNARFRWGVGPALRGQLPHSFGFDVFRVKRTTAEGLGWDATPPTPAAILSALNSYDPTDANPDISMANELPVLVGDLLTPVQAADAGDRERFDFADDGIWYIGADGKSVRRPYVDGESFYYFVAARGISGAPGTLSPGALVQMCDRLAPPPPGIFSVLSNFVRPADPADWEVQGGSQHLQVKIRQMSGVTGYYLYRWNGSQDYLNSLGNPVTNRVGGLIPNESGKTFITFDDDGPGSPTLATHANRTVWYTVRAVGESACAGEVLSGHSAPSAGVIRDFKAPDGPTGDFLITRISPNAAFINRSEKNPTDNGLPADFTGIGIRVDRTQAEIAETRILVERRLPDLSWLPLYSGQLAFQLTDSVRIDLPIRESNVESNVMRVTVHGIAANGLVSAPATRVIYSSKQTQYPVYLFNVGAAVDTHLISEPVEPVHEFADAAGNIYPITGSISFATGQGVSEWRVYRRVGSDGPLSLIAKEEGATIPNPGTWSDGTPPAGNGVTVCYYGQVFDENANPSPLIPLGCTMISNSDLPTPMLAPAEIVGQAGDSITVKLEWFCDPAGVDRFEILCAVEGGGVPDVQGLSPVLDDVNVITVPAAAPELAFFPFQTSRVGATLGAGPNFEIQAIIPADRRAYFAVRTCGPGAFPRAHGSTSNVVFVDWLPEDTGAQPVIPWPARPMPGKFESRRQIESYTSSEGPFWPIKPPSDYGVATAINIGITRDPVTTNSNSSLATLDSPKTPDKYLYQIRETSETSTHLSDLMPFMLYRYQMPSTAFPTARANLVQCTPLIDRISWVYDSGAKDKGYQIRDPFLFFFPFFQNSFFTLPFAGDWNETTLPTLANPFEPNNRPPYLENATGGIFVKDPMPVIRGAKYRYLIVQFQPRGEIKRIIPIEPVQQ